jgi:hypothetical protein
MTSGSNRTTLAATETATEAGRERERERECDGRGSRLMVYFEVR